MDIRLIQTSDAYFYYPMLMKTAQTVRHYCMANGMLYEQFVGLKRGTMNWHSAYNRIYMLKELLDKGATGWVLYLDADAMIVDQDFDLRSYLRHRNHHGAIFSGYGTPDHKHNINSGGFAINLSHPMGRAVILDYWRAVEAIPDDVFNSSIFWEKDIQEDQYMLYLILDDYLMHKNCGDTFLFEPTNGSFVNNGPFISQQLRSLHDTFEGRLSAISRRVDEILAGREDVRANAGAGIYIPAVHPRLSTSCGIRQYSAICSTGEAGMLVYGPYVDLPAGRYVARIFGDVSPRAGGDTVLTSDVASDFGGRIWSEQRTVVSGAKRGILVEHELDLEHEARQLELRLTIGVQQDISVHAVQILRV